MAVNSVNSADGMTALYQSKSVGAKTNTSLGVDDFLKLIVAQMQNQDMMNPMKDTDMIAQLAQFSSLQAMQNLMLMSSTSYSASLLGKDITVARLSQSGDFTTKTGTVTGVGLYLDNPVVYLDNDPTYYNLGEIMMIGKAPVTENTSTDTTPEEPPADETPPVENTPPLDETPPVAELPPELDEPASDLPEGGTKE